MSIASEVDVATDAVGADNPIFVVGASRSGTSLVKHTLSAHPQIFIAGETHYFDELRSRLKGKGVGPLVGDEERICQNYFMALSHRPYARGGDAEHSRIAREDLAQLARQISPGGDGYFEAFCRMSANLDGDGASPEFSRWGEKTPRHVFRLPDIFARYPDAQVIYLLRDPRAVVASYRDWNNTRFDAAALSENAIALSEVRRAATSYDPALITLMWKSSVNASELARKKYGGHRVRIVKYEDLALDPRQTLTQLAGWLNVEFNESMLNVPNNSSYKAYDRHSSITPESIERWRKKLSSDELTIVDFCAGSSLAQTGYTRATSRMSPAAATRLAIALGKSSVRAVWTNRQRMGENPVRYVARRASHLFKVRS